MRVRDKKEATILLHLVGYVSYYPYVADINNFMVHNSTVNCELFFVPKHNNFGNERSDFVNETSRSSTTLSAMLSKQSRWCCVYLL